MQLRAAPASDLRERRAFWKICGRSPARVDRDCARSALRLLPGSEQELDGLARRAAQRDGQLARAGALDGREPVRGHSYHLCRLAEQRYATGEDRRNVHDRYAVARAVRQGDCDRAGPQSKAANTAAAARRKVWREPYNVPVRVSCRVGWKSRAGASKCACRHLVEQRGGQGRAVNHHGEVALEQRHLRCELAAAKGECERDIKDRDAASRNGSGEDAGSDSDDAAGATGLR
jgi:hypothetical protein